MAGSMPNRCEALDTVAGIAALNDTERGIYGPARYVAGYST